MRLGRLLIIVAILVILGLVAIYALLNLGNGATPPADGGAAQTTDIVMVVQPIPRGGIITADMLGFMTIPSNSVVQGMFTNPDQAIGLRARYDLEPGVPLTQGQVVETADQLSDTGSDTALLIPSGMVAFPIPIDRFSSLAYGLRAGDHVNVISTMLMVDLDGNFQSIMPNYSASVLGTPGGTVLLNSQTADSSSPSLVVDPLLNRLTALIISGGPPSSLGAAITDPVLNQPVYVVPSESQRPRLVSQTLLQDIVILHVGNFLYTDQQGNEVAPPSTAVDATGNAVPASVNPPDLITLIVTPQDAVTLNWLIYAGSDLTLALRSAGDDSIIATQAVTLEFLLTEYDIPVPTKLPYGLNPRVDSLLSPTRQDALPLPPQQ